MPSDDDLSGEDENRRPSSAHDTPGGLEAQPPVMEKKRRKNRKRTVAARGPTAMSASRGTGFEEYYADPPITPAEAQEERVDIYAPELSFEQRIQSCIQRFRSRRRLSSQHSFYFNEYMLLGGVDTNPNAFTGMDPRELKGLTPAERRDATAVDGLHLGSDNGKFYNGDENHWSVDFTAIAQGFLSFSVVSLTGLEEKPLGLCIGVVENFLRYVLQHDVCPEYEDDVIRALGVCQQARDEWPLIFKLQALMPGRLNDAAAEIFNFRDADDWAKIELDESEDSCDKETNSQAKVSAKATVLAAFALLPGEEANFQRLLRALTSGNITTRLVDCAIKLRSVERASEANHELFSRLRLDESHISPVGKADFTRTSIRDGWDEPDQDESAAHVPDQVTLYMDDHILKNMVPGMQMTATLVEIVDVGIYFLKKTGPVLPSFYRFLPQELMKRYKEPRATDRPAPSVHDLEREHGDMTKNAADENGS
ncbi:hypothetical protein NLU13_5887 [Sarocladium strictum]|uniref:Argonaute complex, subunit Arb1 n=1 Tax=Sarocladium strictum TaxID=5046 RepID=A0AA39GEV6_SARSR|nr:hypothetical protein NLU13_5887 [Sarocladium strictum]